MRLDTPAGSAPPPSPWLDAAAGRARTGADAALYRRLLAAFRDGHCDDPTRLRQAIAAADVAGATRIAHGLKGVAGMIGADLLHAAAVAALVSGGRSDGARAPAMQRLVRVLEAVLAAVDAELRVDAAGATGG